VVAINAECLSTNARDPLRIQTVDTQDGYDEEIQLYTRSGNVINVSAVHF